MQSKASCSKAVLLKQMNKLMVKTYRKLSVIFSLTDAGYNALKILNVKIVVSWLFLNGCNTINKLLNPFTAKCSQRQISTRFPNFIFLNFEKQMVPCESTGREVSFGHIIGFRPQTQTLEAPYKPPLSTLAVKGLKIV